MKLLIVDDNAINLRLLAAQLASEGHAVLQANNGVEALRLLDAQEVDGVISDILMPEMDGFRLCLELRRHPRLAALPLLLYTSTYDSSSDRQLARSVGADAFLTKPATPAAIMAALQQARQRNVDPQTASESFANERHVLRQYNEALVRKLEERNLELQHANAQLHKELMERLLVQDQIRVLNESLEQRVAERTNQLETANRELHAANRELEAFSYSVSHDLRGPLRSIDGFCALLQSSHGEALGDEGTQYLQRARRAAQRMGQLIDDLLSLAKTARKTLRLEAVDVSLAVRESLHDFDDEIAHRGIEVRIGALPVLRADPLLIRQVLHNLLANAVKYTRRQPAPLIEVGSRALDGEQLLHVKDNGVGFDMQYAGKLFEAFERLHGQDFDGSGVGLAIVQRIVQRHGGRVWAEAEPERGATFFVALPESTSGFG